jgi:alkylated DNA repair dioxygenase AlkB
MSTAGAGFGIFTGFIYKNQILRWRRQSGEHQKTAAATQGASPLVSSRYTAFVHDLFQSDGVFQRLPAHDAELLYRSSLDIGAPTAAVLSELIELTPWRAESVVVWGKPHLQPRLTAWYGDDDARYEYSGLVLDPLRWTPRLLAIKASVERAAGCRFNSVLLNYYRNERDSMGMHSDDEPELGPEPVIASLSLGAVRTLMFRHRFDRARNALRIELADGSLLLMRGATQSHWKHGIAKERRPCGARVNLTFRRIVPARPFDAAVRRRGSGDRNGHRPDDSLVPHA